jgi:hypothetical protein
VKPKQQYRLKCKERVSDRVNARQLLSTSIHQIYDDSPLLPMSHPKDPLESTNTWLQGMRPIKIHDILMSAKGSSGDLEDQEILVQSNLYCVASQRKLRKNNLNGAKLPKLNVPSNHLGLTNDPLN